METKKEKESCGCGGPVNNNIKYISAASCSDGVDTPVGKYPRVYKKWKLEDYLGEWGVRVGINRNAYAIEPGMYALNTPDKDSPVLVSANYKLSFDVLRREAGDLNAWILVVDTKGVNVWCAAGKGTFCAEEIARVVELEKTAKVVSHRTLILPQLSAPGVAAFELPKYCGFRGIFGPVEAYDIKNFLNNKMKASVKEREVTFDAGRRLEVAWLEFTGVLAIVIAAALILFGALFIFKGADMFITKLTAVLGALIASAIAGSFVFALLLPYMPGRSFSPKGALLGAITGLIAGILAGQGAVFTAGLTLLSAALSSYAAVNYTGATTFTSLSGVKKELGFSLPLIIVFALAGVVTLLVSFFSGRPL